MPRYDLPDCVLDDAAYGGFTVGDPTQGAPPDLVEPSTQTAREPFSAVVGQRKAVELLRRLARGVTYGLAAPPICFTGRSGRGKTLLATEFSRAVGMRCVRVACGKEMGPADLIRLVTSNIEATLFFLDEIQSLPRRCQEILFSAIDRCQVPKLRGSSIDRTDEVNIGAHVWVAATNLPGNLLAALQTRMLFLHLDDYELADLETMGEQFALRYDMTLTESALQLAAAACGGSPRKLGQIIETTAVFTVVQRYDASAAAEDDSVDDEAVLQVLNLLGIDHCGLDPAERTLLTTIQAQPTRAASAEMLAFAAGLDVSFIRQRLANLRCRRLLNATTGRGWTLTAEGEAMLASPSKPR